MREMGDRLKARAKELGLTDAEVARRLDLAQGRYSNYVNANREPDMATFVRICRELSTTPNELLGFEDAGRERAIGTRATAQALLDGLDDGLLELAIALLRVTGGVGGSVNDRMSSGPSIATLPANGRKRSGSETNGKPGSRGKRSR